jgi:nicotinic acid mononucleotide adenylyltransferase
MEAGLDPARVILCLMGTPDVAATEIRRLSAHSRAIDSLVPAEVESYIRERGLYGGMAPEGIIG